MAITIKASCEVCNFGVTVEGAVSPTEAITSINNHLENNQTHQIVQSSVWTDNPYIPPTEE